MEECSTGFSTQNELTIFSTSSRVQFSSKNFRQSDVLPFAFTITISRPPTD